MASITTKERSPFWHLCFTDLSGRRLKRSTKIPVKPSKNDPRSESELRSLALSQAVEIEKLARGGSPSELQLRKLVNEISTKLEGKPLHFKTCGEWLDSWIQSKKASTSESTFEKYRSTIKEFREYLGKRLDQALETISPSDIFGFQKQLIESGRSASTVNQLMSKIVNASFSEAQKLGYIPLNPCHTVKAIRDKSRNEKEAFTPEQLEALVATAEESDWAGAIICGGTNGFRLQDVANLEWGMIDRKKKVIRLDSRKTGYRHTSPIHPDFWNWLEGRTQGVGKAPVFPKLYGRNGAGKSGLSMEFKRLMDRAGVKGEILKKRVGIGRSVSSLSFHSLRHTAISMMANNGVAEELRMKLVGHTTKKTHADYSHHEIETMRQAVESISLFGGGRK